MAASLSIQQRAYLAEFGRQWFRRALSVTDERESAAALFPVSSSSSGAKKRNLITHKIGMLFNLDVSY
jgi:hypothetical protein